MKYRMGGRIDTVVTDGVPMTIGELTKEGVICRYRFKDGMLQTDAPDSSFLRLVAYLSGLYRALFGGEYERVSEG